MNYDYIIIGGGISGLYVAYNILKKKRGSRILILEKANYFGGRIFTYSDPNMSVEAGAGRFNTTHHLFIRLLKELGLYKKKVKNSSSVGHYYIDHHTNTTRYMDSIIDYQPTASSVSSVASSASLQIPVSGVIENNFLELWLFKSKGILPNAGLIVRILAAAKITSKKVMISMTFVEFAKTVLPPDDVDFLIGSFGYYSELVLMNAFDCCNLIMELDPSNQFYSLNGGLSQVTDELVKQIRLLGVLLLTQRFVKDIRYGANHGEYIVSGVNENDHSCRFSFKGRAVICALPKHAMEYFAIFRPILPLIRPVLSAPLCRIYAKYPLANAGAGHVWFRGLSKFTVNNELRMVIPISEKDGVIMISYSDNKFAEFWKGVYDRRGEPGLNKELQRLFLQATGITIPDAIEIRCFFWKFGVGYWGKGADSAKISRVVAQPFLGESIYICNENFSNKYQQWMEGALDSSSRVLQKILVG